jgi:hypothetical protein
MATATPTDTPADTPTAPPTITSTRAPPHPAAGRCTAAGEQRDAGVDRPSLRHRRRRRPAQRRSRRDSRPALGGLGARIARTGERRERTRGRRAIASAMLFELRRIDAVLRRVVALDTPSSFPSLDHPIMEGALRDLTLFNAETAARIAQFHGALRGIQHEIADYRDNPLRWAGRLGELNQLIKGRAAAACRAVPDLLKALERSGGARPPHLGEPPASSGERAELPPRRLRH